MVNTPLKGLGLFFKQTIQKGSSESYENQRSDQNTMFTMHEFSAKGGESMPLKPGQLLTSLKGGDREQDWFLDEK